MIYLVNIVTLVVALEFALALNQSKHLLAVALASIVVGVLLHWFHAIDRAREGVCKLDSAESILQYIREIDSCIDYEVGEMIFPQALVIAGFTVVVVRLVRRFRLK